ncbi:unnamed protein product [Arctogadus glacialis]
METRGAHAGPLDASVSGQDVRRQSGGGQVTSRVSLDSDLSNQRHGCDSPARLALVEDSAVEQSALQKSATSGGLQELSRQRLLRPDLHTRDGLASIGCRGSGQLARRHLLPSRRLHRKIRRWSCCQPHLSEEPDPSAKALLSPSEGVCHRAGKSLAVRKVD